MKQFTSKEIQDAFEKLPQDVQTALTSVDLNNKVKSIAERYNLHMDQLGNLVDEVGLVMLGLQKSSSFIDGLCSRLSIDARIAENITRDINTDIFSSIKQHLMELDVEMTPQQPKTDLERLGDFTIDKTPTAGNETNGTTVEKRPDILEGVENPQSAKRTFVTNTEPLVDHLLNTPVTIPPQKINQPTAGVAPDPYREPTN